MELPFRRWRRVFRPSGSSGRRALLLAVLGVGGLLLCWATKAAAAEPVKKENPALRAAAALY